MPQTVFDVGDPITSILTLGVVPDGTTNAVLTVQRPDGQVVAGISPGSWAGLNGDQKTAQWYATDDGTPTGTAANAAGDWVAVWKVTGLGASVTPKVYNVRPLPGTGTRPSWTPFLSDVADYVPWLTVDTVTVGSQQFLGTFTGYTTPTDEQAQRIIDKAASLTATGLGAFTSALYPAVGAATAIRAAAMLARIYARNSDDLTRATQLDTMADNARQTVIDGTEEEGTSSTVGTPVWFFPEPVPHGDLNL